MYISYNWIRELTETTLSPVDLSERLTMAGLAVEGINEVGDDCVLDFDLTSNRPDCLSHLGIAREVAAFHGGHVILPGSTFADPQEASASSVSVEIEDADLCPRYAVRVVEGVQVGPSPEWLITRLGAIGQRSINNIADITNYVLHEQGQPLHAFDLSKVRQKRLMVRSARSGERIKTLDGIDRALDEQMLVIADTSKPIAIAGVMGGEETEISDVTRDVLLESAYFNPASVRRTSRLLGLHTEASHRFERGVDIEGVLRAQERTIQLIRELAGGAANDSILDVYPKRIQPKFVLLRPARVKALTGLNVSDPEIQRILLALGFLRETGSSSAAESSLPSGERSPPWLFRVPTWRVDIEIEEDLVEEVARWFGYDNIRADLPASNIAGEYHRYEEPRRSIRRSLQSAGYDEAVGFSFIDGESDDAFERITGLTRDEGFPPATVSLRNPIIEGAARMRSTLLPGLLASTRLNFNHGSRNVRLFELGRVFSANHDPGNLPIEIESVAVVATGELTEEGRTGSERTLDFYDVKGAIEAAVDSLNVGAIDFQPGRVKHFQTGQQASIWFAGRKIGSLGKLSDSLVKRYKFRQPVYAAELNLEKLLSAHRLNTSYHSLPRFPSITRDISLIVNKTAQLNDVTRVILGQGIEDIRAVKFVSAFEGESVPKGKRSLALRLEYRSDARTLRDEEVDKINSSIVTALEKELGAYLRG